jgi:hypothetical protein
VNIINAADKITEDEYIRLIADENVAESLHNIFNEPTEKSPETYEVIYKNSGNMLGGTKIDSKDLWMQGHTPNHGKQGFDERLSKHCQKS